MDGLQRLARKESTFYGDIEMNDFAKPDNLHRGVKMALDTGEAASIDEAYELFARYKIGISTGSVVASSRAHQAALLTMVNAGRRSLLGGVHVFGLPDAPLLIELPGGQKSLADAVVAMGGTLSDQPTDQMPIVLLGKQENEGHSSIVLSVTFDGWRAAVGPVDDLLRLEEGELEVLGAVLAGAMVVSEVFQTLRGHVLAARRIVGLSLWSPEIDWRAAQGGPHAFVLPSRLWLVGLGHLGQAYLWTLAMLPFAKPSELELTLQDFDRLTSSNDSTSMLTQASQERRLKTREMAGWLEARGFVTHIVERRFDGRLFLGESDPRIALFGVDNSEARARIDEAGFDLVVEAGLGAGPQEYLTMRIHTFPATVPSLQKWGEVIDEKESPKSPAYDSLLESGAVDECGLVQLASRTVGAPFVGVIAACLVLAEVFKRLNGIGGLEVIDLNLRAPDLREAVAANNLDTSWNPGFTTLST